METRVAVLTQARRPKEEDSGVQARSEHVCNAGTQRARTLSNDEEEKRFVLENDVSHEGPLIYDIAHRRTCNTSSVSAT